MFLFEIVLVLAAACGLMAAVFWVRVATSRSLNMAGRLDGTEKLVERANRRAFTAAAIATGLTLLLAVAAYIIGRGVDAF